MVTTTEMTKRQNVSTQSKILSPLPLRIVNGAVTWKTCKATQATPARGHPIVPGGGMPPMGDGSNPLRICDDPTYRPK